MEKSVLKALLAVFLLISSLGFSQGGQSITGYVYYHGLSQYPMGNVIAKLYNSSNSIIAMATQGAEHHNICR